MSATLRNERYGVVALGASAGGPDALKALLAALPADFPTPVLVVQHRFDCGHDYLAKILGQHSVLDVVAAVSGARPLPGQAVIAPPGFHLELDADGRLRMERTDLVNFACPAIDVLFASVARHAGPRAIACVLTGDGSDGAAGVQAVRKAGGFVIAQSPRSAAHPDMPSAAIETGKVDLVLPLRAIGFALTTLVSEKPARTVAAL